MLGQPAGMKVGLKNSEPAECSGGSSVCMANPGGEVTPQLSLPDKQGTSVHKRLFLFGFRKDLVSSQKPLPVHCVNSPSRHGWLYATTTADRVRCTVLSGRRSQD